MYGVPLALFPNLSDLYKQLHDFVQEMEDVDERIESGIVSVGDAAAYANVWEWGNLRQTKEGPKTTLGINPDGDQVWLTIQAPYGYIRVNMETYQLIMMEEIDKVNFAQTSGRDIDKQLKRATDRISKRILEVLKDTVPVDSGDLQDSLHVYTMAEMTDIDEDD